jgi:L,D-transpeptidase catalytic domain
VALSSQRVSVYSARGKMLEAPVSTGKGGYETPAGIYSVIEKHRDHYSNLYDDAAMPFMQRLTWSGIALHSGALPGYPASHGCIRMPHDFAGQLFDASRMGMRVVVVRDDMSPVEFSHPALFKPTQPARQSMLAVKAAAAEAAAKKALDAKRAANRASREAEDYEERLIIAREEKGTAEAQINEAEQLIKMEGASLAQKLKSILTKARAQLGRAQTEIDAIFAQGKAKIDAAATARKDAKAALAASIDAQNEAKALEGEPVSVFISRKTQRLYVRKAFEPLFESEVTIANPSAPIGTTIFTVLGYVSDGSGLRWSALAMYPAGRGGRGPGPAATSVEAAKAALERVTIPTDALDRINELISPASSLIISDEPMSRETAKGTDFIVLMSGEPQGGIRRRPRNPDLARGYDGPYSGGGNPNPFSWW